MMMMMMMTMMVIMMMMAFEGHTNNHRETAHNVGITAKPSEKACPVTKFHENSQNFE